MLLRRLKTVSKHEIGKPARRSYLISGFKTFNQETLVGAFSVIVKSSRRFVVSPSLVPGEEGGGHEVDAGVLHAAEGEGGGHHQDVVDAPHVGAEQLLPRPQHRIRV